MSIRILPRKGKHRVKDVAPVGPFLPPEPQPAPLTVAMLSPLPAPVMSGAHAGWAQLPSGYPAEPSQISRPYVHDPEGELPSPVHVTVACSCPCGCRLPAEPFGPSVLRAKCHMCIAGHHKPPTEQELDSIAGMAAITPPAAAFDVWTAGGAA